MTTPPRPPPRLSRRAFLTATLAAAAAACSGSSDPQAAAPGASPTPTRPRSTTAASTPTAEPTATPAPTSPPVPSVSLPGDPFSLGVASGDPDDGSVVLWTRLVAADEAAESLPAEPIPVLWEVATDDTFDEIVASGVHDAVPAWGHSMHVIAAGLQADTSYTYRFRVGDHVSASGRTRTAPAASTPPRPLRLAFSSCQHYESGFYAAHRHLLDEDHELFVFLGDYIYEGPPTSQALIDPRTGTARAHIGSEAADLESYRRRYELYRRDPDLQAHHAAVPWVITWDDHEVENDYAGDHSQVSDRRAFLQRRAAAYQAWYEHMPVRLNPPEGPDLDMHRVLRWGPLADLVVLDGRQYRDPQPTDGEVVPVFGLDEALPVRTVGPTALDPDHTMLGAEQESWLLDTVTASTATWKVLAQQVMMHGLNILPGQDPALVVLDSWDGYYGNRKRILEAMAAAGVEDVVVLTGDFHSSTVGDVKPDPFDDASPVVATEFMAPAISSQFPPVPDAANDLIRLINPHIKMFDTRNGYVVCDVEPDSWTSTYRALADVTEPATSIETIAVFEVTAGVAGARQR